VFFRRTIWSGKNWIYEVSSTFEDFGAQIAWRRATLSRAPNTHAYLVVGMAVRGNAMNLAYVVRCNFNDPAREESWNSWYSGPKLRQMLQKPHFLTGQRYRRTAGQGRNYLAYWTLSSADAFTTPEYTNDWGFFEWRSYIIDWSRDLFQTIDGSSVAAPRVGDGEFLRIVSFEGLGEAEAEERRGRIDAAKPGTVWHKSVGLDRHTPLFGVSIETSPELEPPVEGVNVALYHPISPLAITERAEFSGLVR
jgi:hypothetical protein